MAACSAISRTRSATDLGSMTACPQVANLRYLLPKRKSGPKPTGQIRRSEQAVDYTRRIGRKQARVRTSRPDLTAFREPTSVGFFLANKSLSEVGILNIVYPSRRPFGEEVTDSNHALCRADCAGHGLAVGAYVSRSFCALKPGLITASLCAQS